ncbi:1-aminocyclopropane-1-carboxylate deaminase/D-cysteine desulfhydrase [Gallaecimonas mangrovi]|uniref:1-aminocyclopropane-1-carboxylate deaminase/D-cysteine desulfhydrase n=1 Tax=Gallaecimonas mangrovi TaxID=2291597 RepID=UPI0021F75515|nr:pyridoxal-phosphate dependent enzyme [Gallaecimonas mangrovi]
MLDPLISGNKWRKLKYPISVAKELCYHGVISFGGPHSNHLLALAAACQRQGLAAHGLVRGHQQLTPTLAHCQQLGMALTFVSREDYRKRHDPARLGQWQRPGWLLLPEGGSSPQALDGVAELVRDLDEPWDQIWVPVGSGGTLAGLVFGAKGQGEIVGVAAVKDASLPTKIDELLSTRQCQHRNYRLLTGFEGPGFGKFTPQMAAQMQHLAAQFALPIEPIYTGKMLLAFWQQLQAGLLDGKRIVLIHTGGLQGLEALRQQGRWPVA